MGGVRLVQLRCKNTPLSEQEKLACRLKDIATDFSAALIVNDNPRLCRRVGAMGAHLGREDPSPAAARRLLGKDAIIGVTAHTVDEVMQTDYDRINYISLGPVFSSSLKSDLIPLGIDGLSQLVSAVRRHSQPPIFCIGGIDFSNMELLQELPINGIAVGSLIGTATDPTSVCRRLCQWMHNASDSNRGGLAFKT